MPCTPPSAKRASSISAPLCARPFPDNLPRVTVDERRISVNGLYRHGFLLAPAVAEVTVAHVLGGRTDTGGGAMLVIVNGERTEISATDLRRPARARLDYAGTHVAIAVNYQVVPRARWGDIALSGGDQIEIITPRQGG